MSGRDARLVFDAIPEQFDRWRVRYSPALFDAVVEASGLGPGKRCLEIGPGTGQATDFALDTGCDYQAVEEVRRVPQLQHHQRRF